MLNACSGKLAKESHKSLAWAKEAHYCEVEKRKLNLERAPLKAP